MADEETLAATPGETTEVVNDGIIDLDAPATAEETVEGDEEKPEGETESKPEGEEDGKPKKLSGAARAKVREQRLLSELQAREREIEDLRRTQPAAKTASDSDEKAPREEDFNGDYFAWQRALTAHEAGKAASAAVEKQFQTREQSERQTKQAAVVRERDTAHLERVEDAREVIADFDQVMKKMDGVNVRQELIDEIKSSDNSAVIAYHLAQNPDKLNALNGMSGRELAREMGRLEATVKLPEAKKQTTAPPPLSRPKGGASPSSQQADLASFLKETYGR